MKDKLLKFFSGRNGFDRLSKTIFWPALVLCMLSSFISVEWLRYVLYYASLAAAIYALFRAFSRNLAKRSAENEAYLSWVNRQKKKYGQRRSQFSQQKEYRFFTCPDCGAKMRVPRGKGKVRITCRRCGKCFEKRT